MQGGTAMHIHVLTNIHPNYCLTDFQFVCTVVFLQNDTSYPAVWFNRHPTAFNYGGSIESFSFSTVRS